MKIFILIDQLHSHGGIEKLVAEKANYWTDVFGYEIKILSTEQKGKPLVYQLSEKVEFKDLAIDYYRETSFFHPKNWGKLFQNFLHIKKMMRKEKPDFILVASHIPMTYLLPFIKIKAKIIKEFHFSKYFQSNSFKEKLFNAIERKYNFLVALSKEEASFYPPNNTVVIPNPVKKPEFSIKRITERENVAVAILRFAPVKQIEKMVNIWERFSKKNNDWKLYFYGDKDGDYYDKIKQIVQEKKLENTIFFKGKTNEVSLELNKAKLLLITSQQECFPMVILEANSCGVPVISYDVPTGPRNIIRHNRDGILVEENNEDEFLHCLEILAHDDERLQQFSEAAIENAKNYELQKVMNLWKNLIFEK